MQNVDVEQIDLIAIAIYRTLDFIKKFTMKSAINWFFGQKNMFDPYKPPPYYIKHRWKGVNIVFNV